MTISREMPAMVAHIKANVMTRAEAVDYLAEHYDRDDRHYLRALVDCNMALDRHARRTQRGQRPRRDEYETRPAPRDQQIQTYTDTCGNQVQRIMNAYGIEARPWTATPVVNSPGRIVWSPAAAESSGQESLHEWLERVWRPITRTRRFQNEQEGGDTL